MIQTLGLDIKYVKKKIDNNNNQHVWEDIHTYNREDNNYLIILIEKIKNGQYRSLYYVWTIK